MTRAAKETSWSASVLLAALLAGLASGASSAEASIPTQEPRGVFLEQAVPLLEQAPLLEVPAGEPLMKVAGITVSIVSILGRIDKPLLVPVEMENGETRLVQFDPKGRGSQFKDPATGRFIETPEFYREVAPSTLNASTLDVTEEPRGCGLRWITSRRLRRARWLVKMPVGL